MGRAPRKTCKCELHPKPKRVTYLQYRKHLEFIQARNLLQDIPQVHEQAYADACADHVNSLQDFGQLPGMLDRQHNIQAYTTDYDVSSDLEYSSSEPGSSLADCPGLSLNVDSDFFWSDSDSDISEPLVYNSDVDEDDDAQQADIPFALNLEFLNTQDYEPVSLAEHVRQSFLYYQWKAAGKTSDAAYDYLVKLWEKSQDICGIFSSQRARRHLAQHSQSKPVYYDCCINSCMAYINYIDHTGFNNEFEALDECIHCHEKRYEKVQLTRGPVRQKARKKFLYIPFTPRLQLQCANAQIMEQMKAYRRQFAAPGTIASRQYRDVFDGDIFRALQADLFEDSRTIPLAMSTDGVAIVRQKNFTVWPILLTNLNLPPKERIKLENLLLIGIIPGPKHPKNLDSFLTPMINEFLRLKDGVDAIDGTLPKYERKFRLKAHLILVSGDGPGIEKCMQMTGSNGRYPCRFCFMKGTYSASKKHHYFPHDRDFSMDKRSNMKSDMIRSVLAGTASRDTGYTGLPRLLRLEHSLKFPLGFGLDPMHLVMNVCRYMFQHWSARMAPVQAIEADEDYRLSKDTWKAIGLEMRACRRYVPTALCRTPRSITDHWKSYKAKEWEAWTFLFSKPLLRGRLPDRVFDHWSLFVKAMTLIYKRRLNCGETKVISALFRQFVEVYERIYYRSDEQLSNCKSQFHFLLHLADSIQALGPAFVFWQFPCEQYVGTLEPQATSKRHINTSLYNNVVLKEHIKNVCMSTDLDFLLGDPEMINLESQHRIAPDVFLLAPRMRVRLSATISSALKEYLRAPVEATHGIAWNRLSLGGTIYSSKRSLDHKLDARCNHFVQFMMLDRRTEQYKLAYGLVNLYMQFLHGAAEHIVAIIQVFRHRYDYELDMTYYLEDLGWYCAKVTDIQCLVGLVGSGNLRGKVTSQDDRRQVCIVALSSDISSRSSQ